VLGGGGGTNNVKNTEYIEHQQSHFKIKKYWVNMKINWTTRMLFE
jgi:hypothetical protein